MIIYVICTDPERGQYTAFLEGGQPKATAESAEAAVGTLLMRENLSGLTVVDFEKANKG